MEIRRQLVLAISVVFLLSVALFGLFAVPPLDRFMVEQTNRLMLSEATRASDRIDHWLASRGNLLRMLATELELSQLAPEDPAFKTLLDQTATRFGDKFSYLYCGFENQLHVTTRKTALPSGFDPTTRPWYIAAQAKRDLTFTEPYADIQNGQFSFSIAYPVNTSVRGVLGTDVYLSDLSRLASEAFIHPEAAVVLISQAGQVLFASQPDLATPGEHIASIQQGALQAILTQRSPDGYASGQFFFEGQQRHLLAAPVAASGWQVLVYLPQAAFEREKQRLMEYLGLAVVFGLAGIILTIYLLVGKITRPLEVITAQARQFRPDRPDVDFSAADGSLEVRQLAGSLDAMRGRLMTEIAEKDGLLEETLAQNEEIQALYSQVKAMNDELSLAYREKEKAYLETIKALADSIEAKDNYTRGHSERVLQYAMRFADALGLEQGHKTQLQYTAILHDIGKIAVPLEVLNKPGALTDREYDQIKQHPAVGWRILDNISYLEPVSRAVRQHHEKMDGTGYPDGVAGEQICLLARILAIVDAFDAMTSARPYRSAMSIAVACGELKRCEGRQFDPELVAVFCGQVAPEIELV